MAKNISKNREKRSTSNTLYRFNSSDEPLPVVTDGLDGSSAARQVVDLQVGPDGHTMLTDPDTVPVNP
jgi:hypothetical protein